VDEADVGDPLFAFQVISDHTLGKALPLKLPKHDFGLTVDFQLNCAHNALHRRRADLPPFRGLFALFSACVVHFAVGEVEAQRLYADLILSGNVVFGDYSDLNAVQLRLQHSDSERKPSLFRHFVEFEDVPHFVSADLHHFLAFDFEEL